MKDKIAIVDLNDVQDELYKLMKKQGSECELVDINRKTDFSKYDKIILPFPSKKEKLSFLSDISGVFSKGQTVIGGLLDEDAKISLSDMGVNFVDYFTFETYVLRNAYLTTQGAVRLLLENTKGYIAGKNAVVTGFGRIGKSLALMLKALGIKVFVAVRSDIQAADALSLGFDVFKISQLKSVAFYFDYIFNTIPFRIFEDEDIRRMRDDCIYFEIASKPFGADVNSFKKHEKAFVSGSALPGRFYPKAVADNIYKQIFSFIENEKGEK